MSLTTINILHRIRQGYARQGINFWHITGRLQYLSWCWLQILNIREISVVCLVLTFNFMKKMTRFWWLSRCLSYLVQKFINAHFPSVYPQNQKLIVVVGLLPFIWTKHSILYSSHTTYIISLNIRSDFYTCYESWQCVSWYRYFYLIVDSPSKWCQRYYSPTRHQLQKYCNCNY